MQGKIKNQSASASQTQYTNIGVFLFSRKKQNLFKSRDVQTGNTKPQGNPEPLPH